MVRISGGFDANDFTGRIDEDVDKIKRVFKDASNDAVDVIRNIVATSGRPTSSGPGRIRSGDLYEDVNRRIEEESKDALAISVGWDLEDFDRPYPLYQEEGFTHVPDGSWIPGMHALQDARAEMLNQIERGLKEL